MELEKNLKPLMANLKRLDIGEFIDSRDFDLFILEQKYDEAWKLCLQDVHSRKMGIYTSLSNDDLEDSLGYFLSVLYRESRSKFFNFIDDLLIEFASWSDRWLDISKTNNCLKELGKLNMDSLEFLNEFRKVNQKNKVRKPETIKEKKIPLPLNNQPTKNKKVFVVHGHDDLATEETARYLEKLGLKPIILREQPSKGNTIIEKIEQNSDVSFGVVLYTACDLGTIKTEPNNLKNRARQNVVFEHGFLIGKIGRNNVRALVKGNIETPNDISGVVYISMSEDWRLTLAREIKSSGIEIDLNKAI